MLETVSLDESECGNRFPIETGHWNCIRYSLIEAYLKRASMSL